MKIPSSTSRVRTSFDPELELPKLHQWFAENPHPSRLTLQMYVKELNSLASRQSRKLLEVHNLCYWFKNARAAYKRAELRLKKGSANSAGSSATSHSDRSSSGASSPSSTVPVTRATGPAGSTPAPMNQQPPAQSNVTLNNIDLAQAVNCLLSTATNFTAAAAAAAAAASTSLTSASLPPSAVAAAAAAAGLLPSPHSAAAINLAASLLNSNLINARGQIADPTAPAALAAASILSNQRQLHQQMQIAGIPPPEAAVALFGEQTQPLRQLCTAFNPSKYQFALGMLDNKVLDSNILNAMIFPTSACAPESVITRNELSAGNQLSAVAPNSSNNIDTRRNQHNANSIINNHSQYIHPINHYHNQHRTRLNNSNRTNGF